MPQPRAYSDDEIIAAGERLAASGPVDRRVLHAELGGRGDPNTAWRVWRRHAGGLGSLSVGSPSDVAPARVAPKLPLEAAPHLAQAITAILQGLTSAGAAADATLDRVGRQHLLDRDRLIHERDAVMADRDQLLAAFDDIVDKYDALQASTNEKDALIEAQQREIDALRAAAVLDRAPRMLDESGRLLRPIAGRSMAT
jgi:hypothetical protein